MNFEYLLTFLSLKLQFLKQLSTVMSLYYQRTNQSVDQLIK